MAINRVVALRLKIEGKTYAEIGKALGVSRQRIQQAICPPPGVVAALFTRSGGKCERCGVTVGRGAHTHHLTVSETDPLAYNDLSQLQRLCLPCHMSVHKGPHLFPFRSHVPSAMRERRKKMHRLGITQQAVADRAGCSRFTVCNLLAGRGRSARILAIIDGLIA